MTTYIMLLIALFTAPAPAATFAERWPTNEWPRLQFDVPEEQLYQFGLDSYLVGRCAVFAHRTLCIWDEAQI